MPWLFWDVISDNSAVHGNTHGDIYDTARFINPVAVVLTMSQLELFSMAKFGHATDLPGKLLPTYQIRESQRAKHVSIKISVEGEVEVVVPPRFDRQRLPDILARRQDWIAKTRAKLLRDRAQAPEDWQIDQPKTILFRWRSDHISSDISDTTTLDDTIETWSVDYQNTLSPTTLCIPKANKRLMIKGNTNHLPDCQGVLRKWLAHRAQRDLAPWLRQLGFDLDLPCHRISVRGQKTRWASCSRATAAVPPCFTKKSSGFTGNVATRDRV